MKLKIKVAVIVNYPASKTEKPTRRFQYTVESKDAIYGVGATFEEAMRNYHEELRKSYGVD